MGLRKFRQLLLNTILYQVNPMTCCYLCKLSNHTILSNYNQFTPLEHINDFCNLELWDIPCPTLINEELLDLKPWSKSHSKNNWYIFIINHFLCFKFSLLIQRYVLLLCKLYKNFELRKKYVQIIHSCTSII